MEKAKLRGQLYLLPSPIVDRHLSSLSQELRMAYSQIKHFAVENIRTTRRLLKAIDQQIDIDQLQFYEVNKHSSLEDLNQIIQVIIEGQSVAMVSEAGCPGIADPGSDLVQLAHQAGIVVLPKVGPSSLLLALMASGMSGQQFTFQGYLPIKSHLLDAALKKLQVDARKGVTQIWIEAPYRNDAMFQRLCTTLHGSMLLCVACRLEASDQFVKTQSIDQWNRGATPQLHKKETVFLLGRAGLTRGQ